MVAQPMTTITIPPEAAKALADAVYELTGEGIDMAEARAAFLAMVEKWPGKDIAGYGPPFYGIDLILPLPQENPNGE